MSDTVAAKSKVCGREHVGHSSSIRMAVGKQFHERVSAALAES